MPDTDERELVIRAQNGEVQPFNLLVWRWQKPILNFLFRFLGNRNDAEELCQRTFVRAFQNLGALENPEKFRVWLFQIAANQARDFLRQRRRRRWLPLSPSGKDDGEESAIDLPDPDSLEAEESMQREGVRRILLSALQKIPEEQRKVVIMRTYHDLKFTEIAEILGVPVNTVKSRMYYGLQALRNILEEQNLGKEVRGNDL